MEIGTHDPGKAIRRDYPDTVLVSMAGHGIMRESYRPHRSMSEDDRDSGVPSRLASLMRYMDRRCEDMRATRHRVAKVQIAEDLAATWRSIREIMGGEE